MERFDINGKPLSIGDKVIAAWFGTNSIALCKIVRFTPKGIKIQHHRYWSSKPGTGEKLSLSTEDEIYKIDQ